MKITRDNYEIYFLDYLDGNLENELVDDFLEFLKENTDLKEELQLAGSVKIIADEAISLKKDKLYKEKFDQAEVFENTAVAFVEGDLSEPEKHEFEAYLAVHPDKQNELKLFSKTKLQPDRSITFPGKNKLRHISNGKAVLLWFSRVAAVVALAFMVYYFTSDFHSLESEPAIKGTTSENRIAESPTDDMPADAVKKEEPVSVSENIAVSGDNVQKEQEHIKNTQKPTYNQVIHANNSLTRNPVEAPEEMKTLSASLLSAKMTQATLVPVKSKIEALHTFETEERFLGDVVREKTGLNTLSLNRIARTGLSLLSSISREKFNYETNSGGQITELNFESRLLAFTIPTNQE